MFDANESMENHQFYYCHLYTLITIRLYEIEYTYFCHLICKTYLYKTNWKCGICKEICILTPYASPRDNQLGKCTRVVVSIIIGIRFSLIPNDAINNHMCKWIDHRIIQT